MVISHITNINDDSMDVVRLLSFENHPPTVSWNSGDESNQYTATDLWTKLTRKELVTPVSLGVAKSTAALYFIGVGRNLVQNLCYCGKTQLVNGH